jgi:hypothetical protein
MTYFGCLDHKKTFNIQSLDSYRFLSMSSGIELRIEPSQIKVFFKYTYSHLISSHLAIIRVDPMIYFGSSNQKKK